MPDPGRRRGVRRIPSAGDGALLGRLFDVGPCAVDLMLTTRCNLRCAYCPQTRGLPQEMSAEVVRAAIRWLATSRLVNPTLTLFGGEPLSSPKLVRFALDQVRSLASPGKRPRIRVVTNGICLDEEMTKLLVRRNVQISLSLDGIAAAQDDRAPDSFEKLDRLLVRLLRDHPRHFRERVSVQAILTSRNVRYLSDSFRYFLSRGVRAVDFVPVIPKDAGWGVTTRDELDRQLGEVVRSSAEEFRRHGAIPFGAFQNDGESLLGAAPPGCAWGRRDVLFVDVDGAIAPCSVLAPSVLASPPSGLKPVLQTLGGLNVLNPELPASLVRRERRARKLRRIVSLTPRWGPRGACSACDLRRSCFVCPVAVAGNGGRVPAIHCDVNRLFARHRAAFLVSRKPGARVAEGTSTGDSNAQR